MFSLYEIIPISTSMLRRLARTGPGGRQIRLHDRAVAATQMLPPALMMLFHSHDLEKLFLISYIFKMPG